MNDTLDGRATVGWLLRPLLINEIPRSAGVPLIRLLLNVVKESPPLPTLRCPALAVPVLINIDNGWQPALTQNGSPVSIRFAAARLKSARNPLLKISI